tara:strand:- start:3568 stop:4485 length:918 start_codon:yes stop_codon:yes gene_type:complete
MNNKDVVAVTSRSFSKNKTLVSELRNRYKNVILNTDGESFSGESLINFLKDANKVIVGLEKFDSTIFDNLPNLKVVSKYGVGLNNIDLYQLNKRGIKLGFRPGVNKIPVAELTMLLILMSLRRVHLSMANIKDGIWSQERGHELTNKTIGILGFGNIGKLLTDFLKPYRCKILGFDIQKIKREEVKKCSIEEIFADADIVSIHLPLTDSSKGLIDNKLLDISKKDLKLINTSRGGIVNEKHLYNFLINNERAFAAFDVFEVEPAFNSPLLDLKNFFATSHLGSMTEEGVIAMGLAAIEGLDENSK